ncbi:MAG: hypothetical protein CV045_09760 [Cyanobacteria bacterium M5B4]|nr:MAG: hypothetical protein CV045_09760 [Cyanobacteria bacterium M5B4]
MVQISLPLSGNGAQLSPGGLDELGCGEYPSPNAFLLGISYLVRLGLQHLLQTIGSALELTAYLKPDVDPRSLQSQIVQWGGVETVRIESKEVAWQQILTDLGQLAPSTNALLGDNPLLDSLKISTTDQNLVPTLAEQLSQLPDVDSVWYGQDLILQLQQLTAVINQCSIWGIAILTTIAVIVIYTTIRLVILSRQEEIEIMQLVGASPRWIYGPILLQGVGFGALAVVLASLFLGVTIILISQVLKVWNLSVPELSLGVFPGVFALFGISVATIGTWFSLQETQGKLDSYLPIGGSRKKPIGINT